MHLNYLLLSQWMPAVALLRRWPLKGKERKRLIAEGYRLSEIQSSPVETSAHSLCCRVAEDSIKPITRQDEQNKVSQTSKTVRLFAKFMFFHCKVCYFSLSKLLTVSVVVFCLTEHLYSVQLCTSLVVRERREEGVFVAHVLHRKRRGQQARLAYLWPQ